MLSVSVCAYLSPKRGTEGFDAEVSHGKKKQNLTRPLSPLLFTTAAFDYWVAGSGKKVYSYISLLKMLGFFSPAYPHQGKGSHSQCVRGCNLQGKRTMWKMEVQNGKQTKLPVLFPSNSMSNVNYSAYACLTLISRMLLLPLGVTVGFWNSSNLGSSTYSRSYWSVEKPSNTKVIFVATGGWTLRPFREGVIQCIFRLSSSWLQV